MLLTTERPVIINKPEYKFETVLFLPPNPERRAEGGLRTKGFFKHSYKKGEDGIWYICDTEGNPVKPVPDEVQKKIQEYLSGFNSVADIKELPLITVITVVLNGEKYLEQTIQSVINQNYPNVEYIIIDGGSTDGTLDIIRKYEDFIDYWVSEPDKGIYDAMNKGVRCSVGRWIGFLGSDDFYEIDGLENLIYPFILGESFDICYGNSKVWLENEYLYTRRTSKDVDKIKIDFIFFHPDSITSANVFKNIGLFDTSFKLAADYEFFLHAYFNGYKFLKVDKIVTNYRIMGFSYNFKLAFNEKIRLMNRYRLGLRFRFNLLISFLKWYIKNSLKLKETSFLLQTYRKLKWR